MSNVNKPVPGADQYYPLNDPPIGSVLPEVRPVGVPNRAHIFTQGNM